MPLFPDCRCKHKRNGAARNFCCPNWRNECGVCTSPCENQGICEKPFLCQELNKNYWCDCRPPIHRDYCKFCNAKDKNIVPRVKRPDDDD